MKMSNLPKDLVEEILSRVPLIYLGALRSTCKSWNALSKTRSFVDKHINKAAISGEKQFLMITQFNVRLLGASLDTSENNNVDLSIQQKAKITSRGKPAADVFYKAKVIHCNGVFLGVQGNMLVVWNPYWGQTKWILARPPHDLPNMQEQYALGYDKSSCSHKILRLLGITVKCLDIYDLSAKSWKIPDGTLEHDVEYMRDGVSLKGDTYWYAFDKGSRDAYLFAFDFTREIFGPRLPLPFNKVPMPLNEGYATLSAVKEEKLAVLLHLGVTMYIWVTNKIEPDEVSWSIFLKLNMQPSVRYHYDLFLIDEEKKVAVVFWKDGPAWFQVKPTYDGAYITGENGYVKSVNLGKSPNTLELSRRLCSYVPSSMKIM
ncbi:hypothetical protein CARUB_v10015740mg [Capsella rubella]|uniref:F-box domain-containing protein n=1 Tax=Capsella rubella TaxID=81985 RepID=R0I7M5_9BRAS|nr:putative F-box/kelch-repeat protein At3g20710 [Capsella rubella]EOA32463.1 hypothetical protein CARUB_v10015740mg [Capsella rubella]